MASSLHAGFALAIFFATAAHAARVEFSFRVPPSEIDAFAREVWATVEQPSGAAIRAPAFFLEGDWFAVRVFGATPGNYRLRSIEEDTSSGLVAHPADDPRPAVVTIDKPLPLSFVRIDTRNPRGFALDDGSPYVPIGGNLPWRSQGPVAEHYEDRLGQFKEAGLNWTRIWMCHWGGLNLDWLVGDDVLQPSPGTIDAGVARDWDRVLELAESAGVYVQVVLQHHGQYSTMVNPNWGQNPWNAALPGGFLERPDDFFTSEQARALTRRKYRYVVARWGYSPAVLCWELFNEVHWVDPIRIGRDVSTVAAWHNEMAAHLRSVDVHRHLVTTSFDEINNPIFDRMDFLQPHIYARNMLANTRYIDPVRATIDRPVFFGEFGDDHVRQSEEQKRAGSSLIPPVWSGLMGMLELPAQQWYTDRLIEAGRLGELAAAARFLAATRIAERRDLTPFSPAVESDWRVALVIEPGYGWKRRAEPTIDIPLDGSVPLALATVPGNYVGDPDGMAFGFPSQATFRIDYPRDAFAFVRFDAAGVRGATAEVVLDGKVVERASWPARDDAQEKVPPSEVRIDMAAGPRTVTLRNVAGPDWFQLAGFDTGLDAPALAAVGRRGEDFVALWVWHRDGVYAVRPAESPIGVLVIDDVPKGDWKIQWWDSEAGVPAEATTLAHPGGTLRLGTPPVARHRAVVLTR